MDAFSK
jgi:hypothetical protein